MAVAVGRPSVSAGASLPSAASPPALGVFPLAGGGRRGILGAGSGGLGTAAAVAVGVCMNLGACLGLRGGRGSPRLGCYVMQQCIASSRPDSRDVGEKGPLAYFFFKRILLATVFLGCLLLPAHTFPLVTVEKGAGCGGGLFPPGSPAPRGDQGVGIVNPSVVSRGCRSGSKMKGWDCWVVW